MSRALAAAIVGLILLVAPVSNAATPLLTPDGLGGLRIGMKERDAVRNFHLRVAKDDGVSSYECREDSWPTHPDTWVMAERGVITRIMIADTSKIRTDRGLGVGSKEAEVRRAYGASLKVATAAYEEEPAHDLTFWLPGHKRGILYGTDASGRVVYVRAGSRSIEYIEGCL